MSFATKAPQSRFLAALEGISNGRLMLITPDGARHRFGARGPEAEMQIHDWRLLPRLARHGEAGLGEGWVAGDWHSETLENVLALALDNEGRLAGRQRPLWAGFTDRLASLGRRLRPARPTRAPAEAGNEFYQRWLDPGMSFSGALFGPGDDLACAQARKHARLLSRLAPGDSLLEIGCGWGSFTEVAAECGRRVTALTPSPAQKGYADARLDTRAEVRLGNYRDAAGRFDNIVAIEAIETLGEAHWPAFFATLKARLAPGGRAILQAVTVPDAEFSVQRRPGFLHRQVFPGGVLPCAASIGAEAARAGLRLRKSFAFGQDYARTCRLWSARMLEQRDAILRLGYDEAFLRRWQFHLEGGAAGFATGRCDVVQIELGHADEGR